MLGEGNISSWLDNKIDMSLMVPNSYQSHGRRGKVPYRHVMASEAKQMHIKNAENRTESKDFYSTLILDVSAIKTYFDVMYPSFMSNYSLRLDEKEYCYDWVINEALSKIVKGSGAYFPNHIRHDIFKCVYDEIGYLTETNLRETIDRLGYGFIVGTTVKSMVCGPTLMIARTIHG